MILCFDCGNSRIKVGLGGGLQWHAVTACAHGDSAGLRPQLQAWPRAQCAIGCNVAGAAVARDIETLCDELAIDLRWLTSSAEACGVRNSYEQPAQLGADRWAALIGARASHGGAGLVVNCGTATTIDVLDVGGIFQGGLILPGLDLMKNALIGATAQLRPRAGAHTALPRNTDDAIASGAIEATAGAVERMFARIAGQRDACCLVSGGAASILTPHLSVPARLVDHLVLQGLLRWAEADRL